MKRICRNVARGDVFVYTVVPAAEQLRRTVMIRVMSAVCGVKEAFVITKKGQVPEFTIY